jgi:hypothetical protein
VERKVCLFDFTGDLYHDYEQEELDAIVEDYYRRLDDKGMSVDERKWEFEKITAEARKRRRSKEYESMHNEYMAYVDTCISIGKEPHTAEEWYAVKDATRLKRDRYKRILTNTKFLSIFVAIILVVNWVFFSAKIPEVHDVQKDGLQKMYVNVMIDSSFVSSSTDSYNKTVRIKNVDNAIEYVETYYPLTFVKYRKKDLRKEITKLNNTDIFGEFTEDEYIVIPVLFNPDDEVSSNISKA